jgi:hypothetical protein
VVLGPEVYNIKFVELHRLRGQYGEWGSEPVRKNGRVDGTGL